MTTQMDLSDEEVKLIQKHRQDRERERWFLRGAEAAADLADQWYAQASGQLVRSGEGYKNLAAAIRRLNFEEYSE